MTAARVRRGATLTLFAPLPYFVPVALSLLPSTNDRQSLNLSINANKQIPQRARRS
jgi:hypothetical protein